MERLTSILLVDDDKVTAFLNKLLFKRAYLQNELHIVYDGKEALEFLKERIQQQANGGAAVPNLIFLDMNMPVMDGFGFLEAFQQMEYPGKETTVIVVLTTFLSPKDQDTVKKAGVKDFVNKPLNGTVINNILKKYFAPE